MKEKIDFATVPYQYSMCLNEQCPKADTCLRQLAEQSATEKVVYWNIISPKHLATQQGDCSFYRPVAKVRYAKGFMQMLENLPHKQMEGIVHSLMGHFSRRTYYRVRKGERLLSPIEQEAIVKILKYHGANTMPEFDAYTDDYDW